MKPFSFAAPQTLEEALEIMAKANGRARPLAGGSDLVDQLRTGRRQADVVVDIKNIPEMLRLEYVEGEGLHVGAGVSCSATAQFGPTGQHYPAIKESCLLIGSIQIQNRASMAGNVCNAAPSGDTLPPLLVYDARAMLAGPKGRREVPLSEFFLGPGQTALQPGELLVELLIPPPPPNSDAHFLRFIPRNEMDIAVAGVASLVVRDPGGSSCTEARITLGAVAPTPVRAREAEETLKGQPLDDAAIHRASELAPRAANPITDIRGSIEYRKELCKVLTYRTLRQCLDTLGL